jgi:dTDP-4-dehydrorhamnose reductase
MTARRILVTGAGGQLGRAVVAELDGRAGRTVHGPPLDVVAVDRARLDISSRDAVMAAIVGLEPDIVVNAAAMTHVDACESDPDRAFAVNALGVRHIAEAAALVGAHVCHISTDYVFDGTLGRPYDEWDRPNPIQVYGRSKLGGELEAGPHATIVRTAWVSGPTGRNHVTQVLELARATDRLRFVEDQVGSPTIVTDLAGVVVRLSLDRRPGVFHVTNQGAASRFQFARTVLALAGADPDRVEPIRTADLDPPPPATRPAYSVLDNSALRRGGEDLLPPWEDSLARLLADLS